MPELPPPLSPFNTLSNTHFLHSTGILHSKPEEFCGKPSLRDLCPEDKQRVANLIRELAKLGDEKVLFSEQLEKERKSFSHQVGLDFFYQFCIYRIYHFNILSFVCLFQYEDLVNDKKQIEREHRDLTAKYQDTQKLLSSYQKENMELYNKISEKMNVLLTYANSSDQRFASLVSTYVTL